MVEVDLSGDSIDDKDSAAHMDTLDVPDEFIETDLSEEDDQGG